MQARATRGSVRRKRRTSAEIKARLLRAAREEFQEKGFAGATTAAIARRADVAEIQMFRYFPSKDDLFHESVFAELKQHFNAFNLNHAPQAVDQKRIREYAHLYTSELQAFLKTHAKTLISLFFAETYGATDGASSRALQAFFDDCAALMASRATRAAAVAPGTVVRIAFGALLGCVTYGAWLFPDRAANDPAIADAITDFVLAGIGPHSDLGTAEVQP